MRDPGGTAEGIRRSRTAHTLVLLHQRRGHRSRGAVSGPRCVAGSLRGTGLRRRLGSLSRRLDIALDDRHEEVRGGDSRNDGGQAHERRYCNSVHAWSHGSLALRYYARRGERLERGMTGLCGLRSAFALTRFGETTFALDRERMLAVRQGFEPWVGL